MATLVKRVQTSGLSRPTRRPSQSACAAWSGRGSGILGDAFSGLRGRQQRHANAFLVGLLTGRLQRRTGLPWAARGGPIQEDFLPHRKCDQNHAVFTVTKVCVTCLLIGRGSTLPHTPVMRTGVSLFAHGVSQAYRLPWPGCSHVGVLARPWSRGSGHLSAVTGSTSSAGPCFLPEPGWYPGNRGQGLTPWPP